MATDEGREIRTGRHDAGIGLAVVVGDFTLLPAVDGAITAVDTVPQEIRTAIDARLAATAGPLPARAMR